MCKERIEKKTIGISIPCFNEEKNIPILYSQLTNMMSEELSEYNYIIQFIDNASTDNTQRVLEELCEKDKHVRAIFNLINVGLDSAIFNMKHVEGDCVIYMFSDLQDPVSVIPQFVKQWENGYTLAIGIKQSSDENQIMYTLRSLFYKILKKMSGNKAIEQFTGFGLYDREFVNIISKKMDSHISLRSFVAQYGYNMYKIYYNQPKRQYGKSNNNFFSLCSVALSLLVKSSQAGIHFITIFGCILSAICMLVAIFYFIYKIIFWNAIAIGIAPAVIGIFLLGSVQIFFLGLVGEYVLEVSGKLSNNNKLVIRKKINIDDTSSFDEYMLK